MVLQPSWALRTFGQRKLFGDKGVDEEVDNFDQMQLEKCHQ